MPVSPADLDGSAALVPPIFRAIVVAPTHNNAGSLPDILSRLDAVGLPILVVNDGSTDRAAELLNTWSKADIGRHLITHQKNLGKAAALRTAFAEATRLGFTHVVSIDTDGQLFPEDIPLLLRKAISRDSALILGCRDRKAEGSPLRGRLGRWVSNFLVRLETGKMLTDAPCGLRVYPLALVNNAPCRSGKYGFEIEIITRAMWAGIRLVEVPVRCRYFKGSQRVSHFRPIMDSIRMLVLHTRLVGTALYPARRQSRVPGTAPKHSLPYQFVHWLNPLTAWRQIRRHKGARTRFAAAFGVGVFIANMPVYGIQTLFALFAARRFHLHPAAVLAGVNISVPPIGPLLIAMAIGLGHFILHGSIPHLQEYHILEGHLNQVLLPMIMDWIVGSLVLGTVMGGISFLAIDCLLRVISDKQP